MKIELHPVTAIPIIKEFELARRLLRKCTLGNGYGLYYDLFGNKYYISPEAEKTDRKDWTGCIVDDDYYIYVRDAGDVYDEGELNIVNEKDEWFK
jgi:hypothetical protein